MDPFSELLRPPLTFKSDDEQIAYLKKVGEALSWIDDLDYPALVSDAMASDFPIVAVSEGFVRESMHQRKDVLFRNCRFLVELVTGSDAYHISRSDRENMAAFCKLSRYPGTVDSGGAIRASQPNVLGDGSCVTNHFVVFRVYVGGHPLLVGLQNFDKTRSNAPSKEINECISQRMATLMAQIAQSDSLREVLQFADIQCESNTPPTNGFGLYRGEKVSSNLLFFDGGLGVLRQEPQLLPQSGTIFTARPIPMRPDGSRRITIRLDTVMTSSWPDEAGPPMGFTLTHPGSDDVTDYTKLHFVGRSVGFTCIGPMVNHSTVTLQGVGKWREQLDIFSLETFPDPRPGEIVTVELTSNGELKRYRNGVLSNAVATNKVLEHGEWYGVFEVSMNIARATLLEADPFLDTENVLDRTERQLVQIVGAERKLIDERETKDVRDMFVILLSNAQHLSISIASADGDQPLIAVSDGFQSLTGYRRCDVLGRNCRFLNTASGLSDKDRADIRQAIKTGEHFCSVIPNIRADGSGFHNLLDLRTLEIGKDEFGKPARFIVGIQGEVDRTLKPNQWKRALPTLSETLRCNLGIILQAFQKEFQINDGLYPVMPHPVPFWVDAQH